MADENGTYAFDTVAIYSCDTGFSLVGDNSTTCTGFDTDSGTSGAFEGEPPTCEGELLLYFNNTFYSITLYTVITCPPLNDPTNGTVTYNVESDHLEFGKQAIYNCSTGFALVGNTTRTCTGDGSSITGFFEGEIPTCESECMRSKLLLRSL